MSASNLGKISNLWATMPSILKGSEEYGGFRGGVGKFGHHGESFY
jgi:hypothetical protein